MTRSCILVAILVAPFFFFGCATTPEEAAYRGAFNAEKNADTGTTSLPPEEAAYRGAFNVLKAGRYDQSIKAFRDFLVKYPGSRDADNAQYWLAESYYVTRQFEPAIVEYTKLVQNYPQSEKLTPALLKIGYCYHELGQIDQAKASLEQLKISHPYATASVLANERLDCINHNYNVRTAVLDAEGKPLYYLEVCRDGHTPQVILESPHPIRSPTWSPDRRELGYISFESGRPQIFVQDIASGQRRLVDSYPGLSVNNDPSITPSIARTDSKEDPASHTNTTSRPATIVNIPSSPKAPVSAEHVAPAYDERLGFKRDLTISEFKPEGNLKTTMRVDVKDSRVPGVAEYEGTFEFDLITGRPMFWYDGAEHTIRGKVKLNDYVFDSDPTRPLVFRMVSGKGYVLQSGKGIVTDPSGTKIQVNRRTSRKHVK